MNLHDPAAWLGLTIIVCIVGAYAVWWFLDRDAAREEIARTFWEDRMQPNRDGEHTPHTPLDVLEERPLLPDDYRKWNR